MGREPLSRWMPPFSEGQRRANIVADIYQRVIEKGEQVARRYARRHHIQIPKGMSAKKWLEHLTLEVTAPPNDENS